MSGRRLLVIETQADHRGSHPHIRSPLVSQREGRRGDGGSESLPSSAATGWAFAGSAGTRQDEASQVATPKRGRMKRLSKNQAARNPSRMSGEDMVQLENRNQQRTISRRSDLAPRDARTICAYPNTELTIHLR